MAPVEIFKNKNDTLIRKEDYSTSKYYAFNIVNIKLK